MNLKATKTTFPKYPAYKDSGVEWMGEVPEGWKIKKLKFLGKIYPGLNGKKGDDFSKEYHPEMKPFIPFTNIYNNFKIDETKYQFVKVADSELQNRVEKFDLLFLMSSETIEDIGKCSLYDGEDSELYLNSFCKGFRLTSLQVYPYFINYLLKGEAYRKYFSITGRGFTRINIKQEYVNDLVIPLPTILEQTVIANFLDDKTAKIDRVIAQKQQMIALLKERKQIIIQNAVTGQLKMDNGQWIMRPKSEMKHSGVEWIGEIPEGWEVKRLKYVLKERNERSATGDEPLLMMSQVHGLVVRSEFHDKAEVAASSVGNKLVQHGDLVFNKLKAHLGVFFKSTVDFKGLVSPDYAVYYSNGLIQDVKYLELLFRHPVYIGQFIIRATGVAEGLIRLYTGDLFEIPIPIPPKEEQAETLAFIETYSSQVDLLIGSNQSQIEKLKEYKATLIDSAVTGKIKVS